MTNRKAFDLKWVLGAYNLLQVALCVMILNYVRVLEHFAIRNRM